MTTATTADGTTPARTTAGEVIACHECGTVHRLPAMPDDTIARCVACGAKIYIRFEGTVERTLALYLAALALFLVANAFPIMSMAIAGQTNASTILDSAKALYDDGMWPLALAVGLAGCVIPLAKILGMLAVLIPLQLGRRPRWVFGGLPLGRAVPALGDDGGLPAGRDRRLREDAGPGHGPCRRRHVRLRRHDPPAGGGRCPVRRRMRSGGGSPRRRGPTCWPRARAPSCSPAKPATRWCAPRRRTCTGWTCPRCGEALHRRKPDSLNRTWALALTAAILYVPANLLPVLTVISFGQGAPSTIVGGRDRAAAGGHAAGGAAGVLRQHRRAGDQAARAWSSCWSRSTAARPRGCATAPGCTGSSRASGAGRWSTCS